MNTTTNSETLITFMLDNLQDGSSRPLFECYGGQEMPENAEVKMSFEGIVTAEVTGSTMTEDEFNQLTLCWSVEPQLDGSVLYEYMTARETVKLLEVIYEGQTSAWDGSNYRGVLDAEAQEAYDTIADELEELGTVENWGEEEESEEDRLDIESDVFSHSMSEIEEFAPSMYDMIFLGGEVDLSKVTSKHVVYASKFSIGGQDTYQLIDLCGFSKIVGHQEFTYEGFDFVILSENGYRVIEDDFIGRLEFLCEKQGVYNLLDVEYCGLDDLLWLEDEGYIA